MRPSFLAMKVTKEARSGSTYTGVGIELGTEILFPRADPFHLSVIEFVLLSVIKFYAKSIFWIGFCL